MKKSILIAAALMSGVAMAAPVANTNFSPIATEIQEAKVKIEPEALPEPVKTAIATDPSVSGLTIWEAWQWATPEGTYQFKVVFENGTEDKLSKKYDQEGNEIKV